MPCASALPCCRSGCGGSSSRRRGGSSPRPSTPCPRRHRCVPRRCSPPPRSSSAAARSARHRAGREAHAVAIEIGDREREWRALQFLGEFGIAADAVDVAVPWLERALDARAPRGLRGREAIGIYSLGVAHWILGDLPGADGLLAESVERFRALEGSRGHDPLAAQHRRDPDEPSRRADRPSGTSSRTRCSPSSRSPAAPPSATRSRTRRGSRAPEATSIARGRCSTRALRGSRLPATRRGSPRFSSAARTSSSPKANSATRAVHLEPALELRGGLQRPPRPRARPRRASA